MNRKRTAVSGAPPAGHDGARRPPRWRRTLPTAVTAAAVLLAAAPPAWAVEGAPELNRVIDGLRTLLVGLLAGLATLFLTIGGLRYMYAGGDPGEIERAKTALKSAAIGYALAVLAPFFIDVLRSVIQA